MSSSTLIEVFGHIVVSFTRCVTEHCNPEEPEFTPETFANDPLSSTRLAWNYGLDDEPIYQEYPLSNSPQPYIRLRDPCEPEENEDAQDHQQDEDIEKAWKRLRPSALRTVCQSMYIGALISLLTATIIGSMYMLISYVCYQTTRNCEFHQKESIPVKIQWLRTLSDVVGDSFLYMWFFVELHFLLRPHQLTGVRRKLILAAFVLFCLDPLYRVLLQVFGISHSKLSVNQKIPLQVFYLLSVCCQVYFLTNHFRELSRRCKLFFKMITPSCFTFIIAVFIASYIYPTYNKQNEEGKLKIALFSPLFGVIFKVISRLCVQRLWNITHPGYSYVLLVPLYFGSAVMFRVMQADLDNIEYIAILGISHGAAELIERSTIIVVDYICHVIWKRRSAPWGSFRTTRRERLMADIAIMSMLYESTSIVSVNGVLYLYQLIYLQNCSLMLAQKFAIHTSVALVIEWFFTSVSLAIETRYQNIAVMAVWRKRWRRHVLVAIANVVPLAIWTTGKLLKVVHGRFDESEYHPCKMPFTSNI